MDNFISKSIFQKRFPLDRTAGRQINLKWTEKISQKQKKLKIYLGNVRHKGLKNIVYKNYYTTKNEKKVKVRKKKSNFIRKKIDVKDLILK